MDCNWRIMVEDDAYVHETVVFGHNVFVERAVIGENTVVFHNAQIKHGAYIGSNCVINTDSVISEGCIIPSGTELAGNLFIPHNIKVCPGDWYMHGGPVGRENRLWFAIVHANDGHLRWYVGCQRDKTSNQLRKSVALTHRNGSEHYETYMGIIDMVERASAHIRR
jgi:carbonic anhydrase/acetyltransferase-like protein (isoleucine patch superfamily)